GRGRGGGRGRRGGRIFVRAGGAAAGPGGGRVRDADPAGVGTRLGGGEGTPPAALVDARLLIADGHHRYETAVVFHEEDGSEGSAWQLVVIVPTDQEGLTIFPTHRVAKQLKRTGPPSGGDVPGGPAAAVGELASLPPDRSAVALYQGTSTSVVQGDEGELDAALVERLGAHGISYTPRVEDAIAAVRSGEAEAAFLMRPPTLQQVREVAERGETMPQKSTYFFPKLPSGLLFMPL